MSSLPQPLVAYPHPMPMQPSSNPRGSFGPVFIVLAVISIVGVTACIIGRLCARRLCQPKPPSAACNHAVRDIEHGFSMDLPMAKPPAGTKKPEAEPVRNGKLKAGNANKIHQEIKGSDKPRATNPEARPSK